MTGTGGAPCRARRASASGWRKSAQALGVDFVHQAPTFDARLDAHHAAGGVDGRVGGRRRFRSRRLAGLLRHQQRRGQPEPALSQQGRRHVRRRRRRSWASPTSISATPACRWARSGATTTTTARTICSSISYGRPELFHNDQGQALRRGRRARRSADVGERQQRDVARLRPRRPARSVSSPATGPTTSISGSSRRRASCRRASSTRTTAAASTCCTTAATARSRTVPRRSASPAAAGRWRWSRPISVGTGYPDLFLANDYGVSELFANREGKRFTDVGARRPAWGARRRAA